MRVLVLVVLICLYPAYCRSQVVMDYGQYVRWVKSLPISGGAQDVCADGNFAFIARGENGVEVLDITQPAAPVSVNVVPTIYQARALTVSGNLLFVADYLEGLTIFDISDPSEPSLVSNIYHYGEAYDVAVQGQYAYLANGWEGLLIFDITDPTQPQVVGTYETSSVAKGVCVSGNLAYVADLYSGLNIVDVQDPTQPRLVGIADTPHRALKVALAENHAYVADTDSGVVAIDVSDPAHPLVTDLVGARGSVQDVFVSGSSLFLSMYHQGTQILDISDPAHPRISGGVTLYSSGGGMAAVGDFLYATDSYDGLDILDISHPRSPLPLGTSEPIYRPRSLALMGSIGFATSSNNRIKVFDFSNLDAITQIGEYQATYDDDFGGMDVWNGHLVAAFGPTGLKILDASDPTSLHLVGEVTTLQSAVDVKVQGNLAFVAGRFPDFQVVDIGDPEAPVVIGSLELPGRLSEIWIDRDRVYGLMNYDGVQVIDIEDPANPEYLGSMETPTSAQSVCAEGNMAYVAGYQAGTYAIDLGLPGSPALVGEIATPGRIPLRAFILDQILYQADYISGFQVVDVADPAQARCLGGAYFNGGVVDIAFHDDLVFTLGADGIKIFPRQSPTGTGIQTIVLDIKPGSVVNPVPCGPSPHGMIPVAILTTDSFDALTVDHTTVLFGPGKAREAHSNPHGMTRHEEDVDGDGDLDLLFHFRAAEADIPCFATEAGLVGRTFDGHKIEGRDTVQTHGGWESGPTEDGVRISPNPFNPSTTISFSVTTPGQVRIGVYDLRGRLLAEPVRTGYPVGEHSVVWRGMDSRGRGLPSGAYFIRVETNGKRSTRKVSLVR